MQQAEMMNELQAELRYHLNVMQKPSAMLSMLSTAVEAGGFRDVDYALAKFIHNEAQDADPALLFSAALVSYQLGRGHVCLDLEACFDDPDSIFPVNASLLVDDPQYGCVTLQQCMTQIGYAAWIQRLAHAEIVGSGTGNTPLVLVGPRLYLRRYWQHERNIESMIQQRMAKTASIAATLTRHQALFQATLTSLFTAHQGPESDWQKLACAISARSAFSVITGGPGTGKTTTVVRLIALLQTLALADNKATPLTIRLAAPTGKAAARLQSAIASAISSLPVEVRTRVEAHLDSEVSTLHRLLGPQRDSRQFRYNARNPMPVDLLIIDEASMVDLDMMASVLSALPEHARLILIGDKDQLASVEAGSILGELCLRAEQGNYLPSTIDWIQQMTGEIIPSDLQNTAGDALSQHVVMLRKSHRFSDASGIGQLARAVNLGDIAAMRAVWHGAYKDIHYLHFPTDNLQTLTQQLAGKPTNQVIGSGYAAHFSRMSSSQPTLDEDLDTFDQWARSLLTEYSQFQVLCALRNGDAGVEGLNLKIEAALAGQGLIPTNQPWYSGRPVLVTQNNYSLGLMNGDIGLTLHYPLNAAGGRAWGLRVAFIGKDDAVHWVSPSRLNHIQTVYAMTVHKSQGSEFEHALLVLPPKMNPVLTRELLYTGITRAKARFTLVTLDNQTVPEEAAARRVKRASGLSF
ncbi:exodeoxyribonuclease V subunit alpha [Pseudomethylobacillus aquaticus]|nr:exodeoxyribonuclease V subunit alpha [Pseudomethylobacillus aquaticus]